MKKIKVKPKEKRLYSYNGLNSLFTTINTINAVGILIYEGMNILFEKNTSVVYIALSAAVILFFNLLASKYGEIKAKDDSKDNHWYPALFELCILIALPLAMNYFLNHTEVILMIIFIVLLILHTILVVTSAMHEYTLADIKGENKTFIKIGLPVMVLLIPIIVEVFIIIKTLKQAI